MDLLARAGLPASEGVVLTQEAHREFLRRSGLLDDLVFAFRKRQRNQQVSALRKAYQARPLDGGLSRLVRGAAIGLGARTVAVHSRGSSHGGLGTVPTVLSAVREAWLHAGGLERQAAAATNGEGIPLWPVLIQREPYPEYTGWSTTEDPVGVEGVALYGVEPSGAAGGEGVARLTLKAGEVLGEAVWLRWGIEAGRLYLLSVERDDPGIGER